MPTGGPGPRGSNRVVEGTWASQKTPEVAMARPPAWWHLFAKAFGELMDGTYTKRSGSQYQEGGAAPRRER